MPISVCLGHADAAATGAGWAAGTEGGGARR